MTPEQLLQGGIDAITLLGNRIIELEGALKPFAELTGTECDDGGDCTHAAAVLAAGKTPKKGTDA